MFSIVENRIVGGYWPGLHQPSAMCMMRADKRWLEQLQLDSLNAALRRQLPMLATRNEATNNPEGFCRWLIDVVQAVMQEAGVAPLEACQALHAQEEAAVRLQLVVPVPDTRQRAPGQILAWLVDVLNKREPLLDANDAKRLEELLASFRDRAVTAGLNRRWLVAALERNIPWLHVADSLYQFGWGVKGRLLDGTFTDRTSAIAARVARNKVVAGHVLRGAGFPVARQKPVNSADDAVRQAEQLGWPVVIKPVDLDGGVGVATGLGNAAEVRAAYERARQHAENILLENHVAGKDYRVIVLDGGVVGVWERIPGGVRGDGRNKVRDLLAQENADPRRQPAAQRRKQIVLDTEATELLEMQGLRLDDVPAAGRFVRLRRTANIASGGSAEEIAQSAVHPDNRLLCERAARLLRLDLAGVDLLMPDIGRSWFEGGAVICEVNAQPQLASEIPAVLMRALVSGNGRIPVMLVIDDSGNQGWLRTVLAALRDKGVHVGCALGGEVTSGGKPIVSDATTAVQAAQVLLRDPAVEVLILCLQDMAQLKNGFPVDRCDLLVLGGGKDLAGQHESLARSLDAGRPRVLVNADSGLWQQWPLDAARMERVAGGNLAIRATQLLLELRATS